jgi:hypothetical protein
VHGNKTVDISFFTPTTGFPILLVQKDGVLNGISGEGSIMVKVFSIVASLTKVLFIRLLLEETMEVSGENHTVRGAGRRQGDHCEAADRA